MSVSDATARRSTVHFAAVDFIDADERGIAAEVWLDDICRAPWPSKEALKIGAFLSRLAAEGTTTPLHLKDIESRYNIQQGEITMSLNMLQTFRTIEGFDSDRGQIVVRLRLGLLQSIRVREAYARHVALNAGAAASGALTAMAEAMRDTTEQAA